MQATINAMTTHASESGRMQEGNSKMEDQGQQRSGKMPSSPPTDKSYGFECELEEDAFSCRADGFAHADLACALGDATSMMFMTPTPPTMSPTEDTATMKRKEPLGS